jgi:hypothetical protein
MSRLGRLLGLKLRDLVGRPSLWLLLLVLPIAFGLVAGSANQLNHRPDVALGLVDNDQTAASRKVLAGLQDQGWSVRPVDLATAELLLLQNKIDGYIEIDAGFAESITDLKEPRVHYTQARGSLVTELVRDSIAAVILPAYSERVLYNQLVKLYAQKGQAIPGDLATRFAAEIDRSRHAESKLTIDYFGQLILDPTLTFVVSDYSMEVFFLSIYAVLGSLALASAALRQRLVTTRDGLWLDYVVSLLGLYLLGLLQIVLYTAAMQLMMPARLRATDLVLLAVFLLFMLGFGQLLTLISESIRLFLSLLILLLLAIAGGCFFQLSSLLLVKIGQYSPHGWVLSRLRGFDAAPAWLVASLALAMMGTGYFLQKRRVNLG